MNLYIEGFRQYAVFGGRANRAEFWVFMLANWTVVLFLALIGNPTFDFIGTGFVVLVLAPSASVTIRRLHDTNRSGLFALFLFVPIVWFSVRWSSLPFHVPIPRFKDE